MTTLLDRSSSMRSFCRLASSGLRGGVFAGVLAAAAAAASASPILEAHNDSMTKYLGVATSVQGALPTYMQRGVFLDGSTRSGSPFGWALAGNPFGEPVSGSARYGSISLATGTYEVTETDLALPSPGSGGWVVGRTYNAGQWSLTGCPSSCAKSFSDSNGYQGKNWFQSSQPEIQIVEGATDDKDLIYLVYGADRYVEFKRQGTSGTAFNTFKGVNGAAGAILYTAVATSGEPDTFTFYDQVGHRVVFFGFDADAGVAAGQMWKSIDTAGNTAFVGDVTTGSTAITNGFDANGRILKAYDAGDRRYTYTYTTLDSVKRLTQVKAETKTGGTWASPSGVAEVGKVDYDYYQSGGTTYGDAGNLKMVTITMPLSPSGVSSVAKKYYRYWTGTYNSSTNPGHPNSLQYVVSFEGTRRFDWSDSTMNDSFLTASEGSLKPYAESFFKYDSEHRVSEFWGNGQCGCSGAGNGTHTITYPTTATLGDTSAYSANIAAKTEVSPPEGQAIVGQHFDKTGQPLSRIMTVSSGSTRWNNITDVNGQAVSRDGSGAVDTSSNRTNLTAYDNAQTAFSSAFTRSSSAGVASPVARVSGSDLAGLRSHEKVQVGTGGAANLASTTEYTSASLTVGSVGLVRPMVSDRWSYTQETTTAAGSGSGPTGAYRTAYAYTMHSGDAALRAQQIETTYPSVASGNNGSGSSAVAKATYRTDGRPEFTQSTDGVVGYTGYNSLGQVVTRIVDASSSSSDFTGVTKPSWFTVTGTNHLKTTYTYDAQGRLDTTTLPDGRVTKNYYTRLADQRLVTISIPRVVSGTTFYGPASYTVVNHAGKVEAQGVLAISTSGTTTALASWVSTASADPIATLHASTGGVKKYSTSIYDESGTQLAESRSYFLVPASGTGSAGTNYDATTHAYDGAGRRTKTTDATGTIDAVVYDARSRVTTRKIGTIDSGGSANMETIETRVYDGGGAGDGLLTSRTEYVGAGATGGRTTTYLYDSRNRVKVTTNPIAPHSLVKYDNLGRVVASGQYADTSGLSASSDPTSIATSRLSLSETLYDERGRAWKTIRHKIDTADGSDDDTLASQSWFDSEGRVIKSQGEQLTKTIYDRLGRATRRYVLATTNDSTYAHAADVAGDIVMEETVTGYEASTGNALIKATVSRNWNDRNSGSGETTGALDSNADASDLKVTSANITGRVQITAMWYDALNRLTDTAQYGTNNGSDLDRAGLSVPSRSDTVLVSSTSYNAMGLPEDSTDPRALVARTVYDDAGRRVTSIANYVNGTPSGGIGDDDIHTRYVYTAGLQTQMWIDLDGDGTQDADDQVTTYAFGPTKGSGTMDTFIASNRLLNSVTYPDSTSGTDVVSYAYDARGLEKARKDQAGNIITTAYNDGKLVVTKAVDTLASGFDGNVRAIEYGFDNLGRNTVTYQYDAAVGGSIVNAVQNDYDGWGNPIALYQDWDSGIGDSPANDWSVQHTFAKSAPASGRQTVRATAQDLYRVSTLKQSVGFSYLSSGGRHDDELSRVSKLTVSSVDVASYEYLGAGSVANVRLDATNTFSGVYDPADGTGVYSNMDRFGRVTASKWTKDLSTDRTFYHVTNTFDRNSNITLHDDQIYPNWDSAYTVDGLNRLTSSDSGTWSGGTITSGTRKEDWTSGGLDQLGNWKRYKLDLNHDGDWSDSNEMDDSRTFNVANELTARDTDTSGSANYSPAYDAVGNMTDDGKQYTLVYDAFGRLRFIKDRSNNAVIEEFTYNGLNHRIGWHYDADTDNDVDSNDPWYHFVYDRQWRKVATVRDGDSEAKELFVNHQAGPNGTQNSLPLDATVLRDRHTSSWSAQASGTTYNRAYYCQNYFGGRGDVVAVLSNDGKLSQQVRYSAYGVPIGLPAGDTDADGSIVATPDITQMSGWISGPYDVRGDLDLDGDVDSADMSVLTGNLGLGLGWNKLAVGVDQSLSGVLGGHRKGYCGYEHDWTNHSVMHVRNRAYFAELGRWTRRDPLGYVDGGNLYGYLASRPLEGFDPLGLLGPVKIWFDDNGHMHIGTLGNCSAGHNGVECTEGGVFPGDEPSTTNPDDPNGPPSGESGWKPKVVGGERTIPGMGSWASGTYTMWEPDPVGKRSDLQTEWTVTALNTRLSVKLVTKGITWRMTVQQNVWALDRIIGPITLDRSITIGCTSRGDVHWNYSNGQAGRDWGYTSSTLTHSISMTETASASSKSFNVRYESAMVLYSNPSIEINGSILGVIGATLVLPGGDAVIGTTTPRPMQNITYECIRQGSVQE
jgi:RHS repeat-associated protein